MQQYVTELSKYAIVILMVLFTFCSLTGMWDRIQKLKAVYFFQAVLMFAMQFLLFLNLALVSKNPEYIFLYVFVQVFLLILVILVPVIYEDVNRLLLSNMCMFLGIGMCIVARLSFDKAIRQYIIMLISLAISLLVPFILWRLKFLSRLTWVYGSLGILLLTGVMLFSEETYGSKISFTIGSITFQPSEFVKIIYIFFLAAALCRKQSLKRLIITAALAGIHVLSLVCSRDLGSALIYFVAFVFLVFTATKKYRYLLAGAAGGAVAAVLGFFLFDHVRTRVYSWLNPWEYIDSKGYAITQSLFAISSGGWFGMGLFQGNPSAIPFVEVDFIFSAICEELGGIFGICLILLILNSFLEMMKLAGRLTDRFLRLVVYGIGIVYIFQTFLTIGGGINLIPLTGVTLPFISYGGSSVMTTMLMFFVVQGIYIGNEKKGATPNEVKTKHKSKKILQRIQKPIAKAE